MTTEAPLDVGALVDADQGLFTWLGAAAGAHPDRLVVRGRYGDAEVEVTLAQLEATSRRVAGGLAALGVGEDSTIGAWLPNRVEWAITQFACAALGAGVLGLNTRYRSHELSHLLQTVHVSALVLPSSFLGIDFLGTLESAYRSIRDLDPAFVAPTLVFVGAVPDGAGPIASGALSFEDLVRSAPVDGVVDHGPAISNLFTTSGSTSAPKVAGHDQASILRHAIAGARALDVRADDRILAVLPLCGVFGFSAVMAVVVGGGAAVMMETFDADEGARMLEELAVTHVVGGDEMLGAIFSRVPETSSLASLRRGGIANFAGRSKEVVAQADRRWGAKISGVYGSSELFALSALWPADAGVERRGLGGGLVVDPGIEVRVRDLDTGEPVADGDPGELQFRGYNVTPGYLNNDRANAASFTSDGWFRTGDLGYLAHGGFVYQCRAREALRLRGFLVEPGEIEDYLSEEPSIDEVHVVGVETDQGTRAFAFARPRPGSAIDEADILGRARTRVASYKVPERLLSVAEFPTTTGTNGTKVRFEELRAWARDHLGAPSEEST